MAIKIAIPIGYRRTEPPLCQWPEVHVGIIAMTQEINDGVRSLHRYRLQNGHMYYGYNCTTMFATVPKLAKGRKDPLATTRAAAANGRSNGTSTVGAILDTRFPSIQQNPWRTVPVYL